MDSASWLIIVHINSLSSWLYCYFLVPKINTVSRFLALGAGCREFESLHPDQYFTTTPLKMLKLKLNLIQLSLINILNSSFSKTPIRGMQFQAWILGLGNTQTNLVIWIFCLPDHCRNNLTIRFPRSLFCWRHLILKHLMKFGQIIWRDIGEHVVLDVIFHLPV